MSRVFDTVNVRPLEIDGYRGRLPCVLYEVGSERAAVVFPGQTTHDYRLGGSPARPDLHYVRALLLDLGYDVLETWWRAEDRPEREADRDAWYRENGLAAIRSVGDERVRLLVGRSIGTAALTMLRGTHGALASLWIAPLTKHPAVKEGLSAWTGPKLVVAGDADEAFDRVPSVETIVVPGGDHGLSVGEAVASARALANGLEEVRSWLVRLEAGLSARS